jgi:catechol 2,3-dioxygenase-like lactoylglutathione lyase family enzyme
MRMQQIAALAAMVLLPAALIQPNHAQPAPARPAITGISHLSVYSADTAKSERFYVHDLGAQKRADPENAAGARYYFSPVQFIEVLPLPGGGTSINRLDHVAFNTANAGQLRLYLAAHGVAVPAGVESASDGSLWFDVLDPEGNKVQFVQPPAHPLPVPANALSTHIIHAGILVHFAEAENPFYRGLLGFRPYWHGGRTDDTTDWISQQVPNGTDWIEYMMVGGPETRGIPATVTQNDLGVMDHFSLGVVNIEKTVDLLYAGDRISPKHSPAQLGRDGKWQFNMYDPDGTRAELMEFQASVKSCCSQPTAADPVK